MLELKNIFDVRTPIGDGKAIIIESKDNDYYWTVIMAETGALVTFPQNKIIVRRHYTLGINFSDPEMRKILDVLDPNPVTGRRPPPARND